MPGAVEPEVAVVGGLWYPTRRSQLEDVQDCPKAPAVTHAFTAHFYPAA